MTQDSEFADCMARLQAGDEAAAAQVFHRFAARLLALARHRLDARARAKVDPEDVVQSVYRSFFRRQAAGQYELADWDGLWALLTVITLHKCCHLGDYFRAARRDVRREVALTPAPDFSDPRWQILASEPTPSQALVLAKTVEEILSQLEGYHRDIVQRALQGYTFAEIAAAVGVTDRSVQRVLKRVRERLTEMLGDLEGPQ